MCRTPFYALLYVGMPIALVSAFFQGSLLPLALWVPATFIAVLAASRRKK